MDAAVRERELHDLLFVAGAARDDERLSELAGSIPAGRISTEQPPAPSGAHARQIAPQFAELEHDLLELSALDAPTTVAAASPIPVGRTKDSRNEVVGVSLAAILAAPSISA
jgi:hypothetical protein